MKTNNSEFIYQSLLRLYPDADCQLNYGSPFQLLVAVILSAQTTDISVNKVTQKLFEQYPNATSLADAPIEKIEDIIKQIGLYHSKAKNIKQAAISLSAQYNGEVPNNISELVKLPGVGIKTANVVSAIIYKRPSIAVDTHVARIARRLNLAKEDDQPEVIEKKLEKYFPQDYWIKLHHLFIFFGRYKCLARNPLCEDCPLINLCKNKKNR